MHARDTLLRKHAFRSDDGKQPGGHAATHKLGDHIEQDAAFLLIQLFSLGLP